ncbi:unnamed protein product, partial [Vitis vinifera]
MNVSSFLAAPTTSSFRYLHNETYRSGTFRSVKPTPTKSWPLTKDEIAQLQHSIAQRCPLKVADSDADGLIRANNGPELDMEASWPVAAKQH